MKKNIKRRSMKKPIKRMSTNRLLVNRKSKCRFGERKLLKNALLGSGVIGAGLTAMAVKNISMNNKEKKYVYEENSLVSSGSIPDFKDILTDNPEGIYEGISEIFNVRGANYLKDKIKTTGPILYESVDVKVFKGPKLISNVTKDWDPSRVSYNGQDFLKLPSYLVINLQLPPADGVNYSVVLYYKIRDKTIEILNDENKENNDRIVKAANLLINYIGHINDVKNTDNYKTHVYRRFKLMARVVESGSLDVSKEAIDKVGFNDKPVIFEKKITTFIKDNVVEMDLKMETNGIIDTFLYLKGTSIEEYYDKTGKFNINVAFLMEGKHENELPETLIGETKILGLELVQSKDKDSYFIDNMDESWFPSWPSWPSWKSPNLGLGPGNRDKMLVLMDSVDKNTVINGRIYSTYIKTLISNLSQLSLSPQSLQQLLPIQTDNRNKTDNKKFFMYARYFYYTNIYNKEFKLSSKFITYNASNSNNQTIAKGTCFANEKIYNFYECETKHTKTYRFGFSINNVDSGYGFTEELINKISKFNKGWSSPKKLICISLLTPCNTYACKAIKMGSKTLWKEGYDGIRESTIIESEKNVFNSFGHMFISVPLSKNIQGILYNTETVKSESSENFRDLIDISGPEKIFKTLVDISILYYFNYKSTHTLCYHCKSGKDRTSICDSIVQATFYYINNNKFVKGIPDYEQIRKFSVYFLLYGYIITFYSTGIPGIKISNMPVAKYILNTPELYKFFLGNSALSSS